MRPGHLVATAPAPSATIEITTTFFSVFNLFAMAGWFHRLTYAPRTRISYDSGLL